MVVVDSGPLVAFVDERDSNHTAVANVLNQGNFDFIIPALCVAEATYLIERKFGPLVEARFLESLTEFEIIAPDGDAWLRIGALVRQYADFPLGGTDASVVALAERLDTDLVLTLDRRHFGAIQPAHCQALRLLPD